MKQASMHIASLTLDDNNPRHAKQTASDTESIATLLEKGPDKLLRLARDIIQHGVNPTELVVVMVDDDRNVVLEGNRRVAALKLLHNPKLAPTEKLQRQIAAIAKRGEAPRRVVCVVAESRLQAEHWIKIRHTGENGGIGVVRWSTSEASRFGGRSTPTEKARLFTDAVGDWFSDNLELQQNIQAVREGRITNLGRMIADPTVRSRLGISFDGDVVLSNFPKEKIYQILIRLFADFAGPVSVDQIKTKRLREKYLEHIEELLPKLSDRLDEPEKYSKFSNGDAPSQGNGPEGKAVTEEKKPRRKRLDFEKRLFQSVTLKHASLRTSEVLEEAKKISIDDTPNIAAIMVRAVVDIVATDVASQLGWKRNQDTLKGRIAAVLNQVDPGKIDPNLADAWRLSQEDDGALVLKTLHSFVHSWQSHPLTVDVRKLSRAYSPLLLKVDDLLEKKRN
ncbi:hypothetical protein ABZ930_05945 [Streptomyces sp. NPDC046716]|uniref:hypothetical protein n=1 Tax=Streptomyces sp. NPDC046716 TaxID=3157093 RepID=UPI0033DF922C